MATTIFGSTEPELTDLIDEGISYTLGTRFYRTNDGIISYGSWRFPDTLPSGTVSFRLYDFNTQTLIAASNFVDPIAGEWNRVLLIDEFGPTPIEYTANTHLVAAIFTPDRYVATVGFFDDGDHVNDDIVAPGDTGEGPTRQNGYLETVDQFPGSVSGNSASYFADVEFDVEEIPIDDSEVITVDDSTFNSIADIFQTEQTVIADNFITSANVNQVDQMEIADTFIISVSVGSDDLLSITEEVLNLASLVGQDDINIVDVGMIEQDLVNVNATENLTILEDDGFVYRRLATFIETGNVPINVKVGTQTIMIRTATQAIIIIKTGL